MERPKVKSRSRHGVTHLHLPTKYQLPTPYGSQDIAQTRFYRSRSHHEVAHLYPLTNVPTRYQLPTPYSFRDIARARFYRSRSLRQGKRSNHIGNTQGIEWPKQDFQTQGHCGKVKCQIKVTPLHCTPTPLNQCPCQVSTS